MSFIKKSEVKVRNLNAYLTYGTPKTPSLLFFTYKKIIVPRMSLGQQSREVLASAAKQHLSRSIRSRTKDLCEKLFVPH